MRAIDVWVILCYAGMFSALMEYILILYLTKEDLIYLNIFLNAEKLNSWGITAVNIEAIKCQKLSSRKVTLNDLK